jgi:molybdopterin converting factor subunit 1
MSEQARVLFFATLRDITGVRETRIEFTLGANIADIKATVLEKYPALQQNVDTLIVALNHEFARDDTLVPGGAEIAMFPPVSGGGKATGKPATIVAITEHEINVNTILAEITTPSTGGVCTFTGTVRGITRRGVPHETQWLEYEAYRSMAEAKLEQICSEIRSKWSDVEGITIIQRIGTLRPGEISVVVACSASHRDSGIFEAAHYGIDRVKEIVPVWKKEVSSVGREWVEGEYLPDKGD